MITVSKTIAVATDTVTSSLIYTPSPTTSNIEQTGASTRDGVIKYALIGSSVCVLLLVIAVAVTVIGIQ